MQNSLTLNEKSAFTHHHIARAYKELQLYGFAVRHFLMAVEYDKCHYDSYVSLAEVYVERHEYNLAKTTL